MPAASDPPSGTRLSQLEVDGPPESSLPPEAVPRRSDARPLLEREAEVAALQDLIDPALSGNGRLVAVEGRAGIGKTRLVGEARELARSRGLQELTARGGELEQEFAYGVVRQLFEPLLATAPAEERAALLAGAAGLAEPLFGPLELTASPTAGDASFAMLHGLYWLAANVALRQPTLLAVDDLHWADAPSLRWLVYLARRLEGLPLILVVATRPPDQGEQAALLTELLSDPAAVVVRPIPLSEAAVTLLVRETLSPEADAEFCTACFAATGGNPLLVRELVGALVSQGVSPTADQAARIQAIEPEGVERSVRLRLSRLPPEAAALARAVAILGDDAELDRAAALANLDGESAVDAAAALSRADIFRPELPLAFVHPVVRTAVYSWLTPAERNRDHAKAAMILADRGAASEQVAAQLLLTSPKAERFVVASLREAAQHALAQQAPDNAIAYLRRALEEPPPPEERADILYELGSAERLTLGPAAADHLREALALMGDARRRGETALELGRMLFFGKGRGEEAIDVLESAISDLSRDDSDLRQRLEAGLLTIALEEPSLYPRALERLERLRAQPPDDSLGGRILLAALAYHDARAGSPLGDCVERAERAQSGGLVYAYEAGMGWAHVGFVLTAADRFEAALRLYDEALGDARARGSLFTLTFALLLRGDVAYLSGSLADAEADLRLAVEASASYGPGTGLLTPIAKLADTLMERGDLAAAADALERVASDGGLPETVHLLSFLDSRARLRILQGRTREGLADMLELGERYEGLGGRNPAMHAWRSQAALALLKLGDREDARRLAAEEVELARQWGAPRALGKSLRAAGLVEGSTRGLELLREAVQVLAGSPARLEHARALGDLGAALRRSNQRSEARRLLREGVEIAHSCGATPLIERANEELAATGARPRKVWLTGLDSLTASERRVARLAAEEMSNKDIAQALFVTVKTVEVHLSHVYRKLEISSRRQLPGALAARRETEAVPAGG